MLGTRGVRGSVFLLHGNARRGRRKIFLGGAGRAGAKSSEWGGAVLKIFGAGAAIFPRAGAGWGMHISWEPVQILPPSEF